MVVYIEAKEYTSKSKLCNSIRKEVLLILVMGAPLVEEQELTQEVEIIKQLYL